MSNIKLMLMTIEENTYIPYGPLIIQHDLKKYANIDCEIIYFTDFCKNPYNYDLKCDLLLISNSPDIISKHDFETFVKYVHKLNTPIFIGGSYVDPDYIEKVCKPNNIEYAFIGEGDKIVSLIIKDILNNNDLTQYSNSLYYINTNKNIQELQFNNVPIQDRPRCIHVPDWILDRSENVCIEVSRGCPKQTNNPCNFCSYPKIFRTRCFEDICLELDDVLNRKPNIYVLLGNSNFNQELICKIIKKYPMAHFQVVVEMSEIEFYINYYKTNKLHNIDLMCGFESLSAGRLKLMNKAHYNDISKRLALAQKCYQNKIKFDFNLLVGIPDETQDMLQEEINIMEEFEFLREQVEVRLVYKEYYSPYQKYKDLQSYFDLYYFDEPYNKVEQVKILKPYFNPKLCRLYDKLSGQHTYEIKNYLPDVL